jgi:hypothetical protein
VACCGNDFGIINFLANIFITIFFEFEEGWWVSAFFCLEQSESAKNIPEISGAYFRELKLDHHWMRSREQ